jgi:hypothetical protein
LGGITHTWLSSATAAGIPPINTVADPGPTIVPPCTVVSPTLAAAGMFVYFNANFSQTGRSYGALKPTYYFICYKQNAPLELFLIP